MKKAITLALALSLVTSFTASANSKTAASIGFGTEDSIVIGGYKMSNDPENAYGFYMNGAMDFNMGGTDDLPTVQDGQWFDWHYIDDTATDSVIFNLGVTYTYSEYVVPYAGVGVSWVSDYTHYQSEASSLSYWTKSDDSYGINGNVGVLVHSEYFGLDLGYNTANSEVYAGLALFF